MKLLFILLFTFITNVIIAQDQVMIDLDHDGIIDSIYLNSEGDDFTQLICKLSSKNFKDLASQFIENKEEDGHFTVYEDEGTVKFYNHRNHVERVWVVLQYDESKKEVILIGLGRSKDGDNDQNGAGSSNLNIRTKKYTGNWTYYDYFDDHPAEYRIEMPEIQMSMSFPHISLSAINTNTFSDYYSTCFQVYKRQFDDIFPHGNNSRFGVLFTDLNGDYEMDSVYFDLIELKIKCQLFNYETEEYENLESERVDFYVDDHEIVETSNGIKIVSNQDDQAAYFSFDKQRNKIVVVNSTSKNWINKDLDGDGVVDSVHIIWRDIKVKISYCLSTQDFEEIESAEFVSLEVKINETDEGFEIELYGNKSGVNTNFRYHHQSNTVQCVGMDSWSLYDLRESSVNFLNGNFMGNQEDPDSEERRSTFTIHSKWDFPFIDFESFNEELITDFFERCEVEFDKKEFTQRLKLNLSPSFQTGLFTLGSPEKSIDLEEERFINCELTLQIEDENGNLQELFIDNLDFEGEIILFYDNNIHFKDELGYYIEEDTVILPKNLVHGKYKIRAVVAHPNFIDDLVTEWIDIELPLSLD